MALSVRLPEAFRPLVEDIRKKLDAMPVDIFRPATISEIVCMGVIALWEQRHPGRTADARFVPPPDGKGGPWHLTVILSPEVPDDSAAN